MKELNLMIDTPDGFNKPHLLMEKVFEYIEQDRPVGSKYLSDYTIVYRTDRDKHGCVKKLIDDWSLESIPVTPKSKYGSDKTNAIREMINISDEAIVFYNPKGGDIGSDITMSLLGRTYCHTYLACVRLDKGNKFWGINV